MKNTKLYSLFSWFGFLIILLWMTSCGTRKVITNTTKKENTVENVSTEKKDLEVKENSNVKVTNEVVETDETTTEKTTYTPVDASKPSSFTDGNGNKKELNNTSYTHEKTKSKTNKKGTSKKELTNVKTTKSNVAKSNSNKVKNNEVSKHKDIARTSFNWWWLLLLILLIIVYLFYRYKDKIWWF
ncbi:hypothetical protein DK150_550078 [Flavobacterium psychrophilum]|uniref:hypothetical protein n=1 Tax=Flavobacterium psychrophilum TaxID=96345 RepID=UPI000B7C50E6|nr:hypothetical protein [Flavobacterium psychrophilum]SNA83407.1 hypothetical protein DK150_550078 [Flavobacterium psychrophilum]